MLTTMAAYRLISADINRSMARTAMVPSVERSSAQYLENIVKVRSIDEFLANDRVYTYAMKAFGLEDMTYAKAFMRKVLEEGVDDKSSFANKLADTRYQEFAKAFNFARYGATATAFDRTQQGTVDKYVRQVLEEEEGRQNEGVRLALYFERKAAGIKDPYDVLADPALLRVVQTALGLSPLTSAASVDKQAAMISARLDVGDLQDPEKLRTFMTRFTTMWEVENRSALAVSSAILMGETRELGLNPDLLFSLQNLKLGGL